MSDPILSVCLALPYYLVASLLWILLLCQYSHSTTIQEQKVKDGLTGPDSLNTKVDPAAATSYGSKMLRVLKDYYFMAVLVLMFGMVVYVHVL